MYDSRTDRATYGDDENFRQTHWKSGQKISHHFRESGPRKYKRYAKRAAAKSDRRSNNPRTQFRGYGWGVSNYRNFD